MFQSIPKIKLKDQYNPLILSALFHKLFHNLYTESATLGQLQIQVGNTHYLSYKNKRESNTINVIFFLLTVANSS